MRLLDGGVVECPPLLGGQPRLGRGAVPTFRDAATEDRVLVAEPLDGQA